MVRGFIKKQYKAKSVKNEKTVWLYGYHSVEAALKNPRRRYHRLLVSKNMLDRLTKSSVKLPQATEICLPKQIAKLTNFAIDKDQVHQGIALHVDRLDQIDVLDLQSRNWRHINSDLPPLIVALDQINDPHNIGAIMRTTSLMGGHALLTTWRQAPCETGSLNAYPMCKWVTLAKL